MQPERDGGKHRRALCSAPHSRAAPGEEWGYDASASGAQDGARRWKGTEATWDVANISDGNAFGTQCAASRCASRVGFPRSVVRVHPLQRL